MKLQTSLDPMSVQKTETPSASVVLRRRYGRSRFVIVAASWITVLNMLLQPLVALAGTYTWDHDGAFTGSKNWSTGGSWNPDGAPSFAAGDTLDLSTINITGASICLLDASTGNITLGGITIGDINTTHTWAINRSGTQVFNMNNGGSAAQIQQTSTSAGSTISVPLVLYSNLEILNASAGALTFSGGITANSGTLSITNKGTGAGAVTISTAIGNGGGTVSLVQQSGTSGLTLTATNTYTGSTTVNGGTLILSGIATTVGKLQNTTSVTIAGGGILQVGSTGNAVGENNLADQINTGATLTMGSSTFGGGTFRLALPANAANTYAHTQTLASLSLAPGNNTINSVNTAGGTSTATLTFTSGTISRSVGATVDVRTATGFGAVAGTGGVVFGGTPTLTYGIIGGYATCGAIVGGNSAYDWATVDGSNNLIPFTSYNTKNDLSTWSTNDNILVDAKNGPALSNSIPTVTINSLRIIPLTTNPPTTLTIGGSNTLTIGTGGILVDLLQSNPLVLISGGTITSGGSELIIWNENSNGETFTIDSKISGAISLTQSGASTLILKNAANEMGDIYLNAGTMTSTIQGALGPADDGASPTPSPYTIRLLGGNLSLTTLLQTVGKDIYFGRTGTITGSSTLQTLTGNITAQQTNVAGANNVIIAGDGAGVVLLKPASGKDVNIGGNLTVSSGGVALASTGELPAGNLNINGGVLVLDGRSSGNDVIRATVLPTYGTGAGQWQYTSGGFAARGADITISSSGIGANFGFDRPFTLGSAARDADGAFFANANVTISQNINLGAVRTITLAATSPGLTYGTGAGITNIISGNISGNGAITINAPAFTNNYYGELVLSGTSTWIGAAATNLGPGSLLIINNNSTGGIVRFDGQNSVPNGSGGLNSLLKMVAPNGSTIGGFMFTGATGVTGTGGTTYSLNSGYRILLGTGVLGSQGGDATFQNSIVMLATNVDKPTGGSAAILNLIVRDGAFTLGSTSNPITFRSFYNNVLNVSTYDTTTAFSVTAASVTGTRTFQKLGIGTAVLGNVAYENGFDNSDSSGTMPFTFGGGAAGVFQGAIRETGSVGTNSLVANKLTMQGGVLEFGATPRSITLGTAAGNVDMSGTGGGGFSTWDSTTGTTRNISLNSGAAIVWVGTGVTSNWVGDAKPLIFGSTTANGTANLQNNISLTGSTAGKTQYIASVRGVGTVAEGQLNGIISNASAANLVYTGMVKPDGTSLAAGSILVSNANNSYTGTTTIQSGTVLAGGNAPGVAGNGVFGNATNAILLGGTRTTQTPVRAASTANIAGYSGGLIDLAWQAIDGVTLSAGDRVLLKDQTTAAQNGVYTVSNNGGLMRLTQTTQTANDQVQVTYGALAAGRTYYAASATVWALDTDQNVGLLTNGAFTIGRNITVGGSTLGTARIGQNDGSTTGQFTGNITLNKAVTLVAKAGGTVEFNTGTWTTNDKTVNIGAAGYTGTVLINNTLTTAGGVNVNAGTLGGTGTIGGSVTVNAGGTLAPGTGLGTGTLTASSVAFANDPTAKLQVGLTSTTSDKLSVTGTATLTGATLTASFIGSGSLQNSYTVLTATGGVTGTFTNPKVTVNGEDLIIVYDGKDVKLEKPSAGTLILFK